MKTNWELPSEPDLPLRRQILTSREMTEADLNQSLEQLPDETLFTNIHLVAERIRTALYRNEPLVIFGHDDPDGITSTYILYRYLESCGYQKHHYFIPNRNLEHHGIQQSFIDFVKNGRYPLVITVDNGISAYSGVETLKEMGCEVIITDHHLVQPDQIPNAYAILNPQLPDDQYPFKMLAGVGVSLMLIRYLSRMLEHPVEPSLYFWTAVGSIADKVPMVGLNRIIIRYVLEHWDEVKDNTVEFLLRNYNRITSDTDKMNFLQYCTRLIANGREKEGQHIAMRFLLQLSDEKVRLFQLLEEEKNSWETALNSVFKLVETLLQDFNGEAFIYYDDEDLIPYSLLGTAATYVVNNLSIPAVFIKKRSSTLVCEGRCSKGFNMVEAFSYCKSSLIQFGGHARAAGFTLDPANYNDFIELFHEYIDKQSENMQQAHNLKIDAVLSCEDVSSHLWQDLETLLPYGQENPEPILLVRQCALNQLTEKLSIDYGNIKIPTEGVWDVIFQLKNSNQIRILDYRSAISDS